MLAFEFVEQLHAAAALCGNAGPHRSVSLETWSELFNRAVEGVTKARRLLKQDTTTCDSLRRTWVARPPSWLRQLVRASSLREEVLRSQSILERVVEPVRRLVRHLRVGGKAQNPKTNPKLTVDLRSNGYTIGRALKDEAFRKVDTKYLDLPEVGAKLLDLATFLAYPFNLLFTEPYLRRCMVADPAPVKGHRSPNLAKGQSREGLIDALRHMLYFSDSPEFLGAPANGLFALLKRLDEEGVEHHRLIFDGIPGNSHFSMAKFQQLYAELVAARPDLAAAISCGEKLMNIGSPSEITDLPPGILSRSSGDFANFFFQFEAPSSSNATRGSSTSPGTQWGDPMCLSCVWECGCCGTTFQFGSCTCRTLVPSSPGTGRPALSPGTTVGRFSPAPQGPCDSQEVGIRTERRNGAMAKRP